MKGICLLLLSLLLLQIFIIIVVVVLMFFSCCYCCYRYNVCIHLYTYIVCMYTCICLLAYLFVYQGNIFMLNIWKTTTKNISKKKKLEKIFHFLFLLLWLTVAQKRFSRAEIFCNFWTNIENLCFKLFYNFYFIKISLVVFDVFRVKVELLVYK